MLRKLAAVALLTCTCTGAFAQRKPFHTEIWTVDHRRLLAGADLVGDSVVVLHNGTDRLSLIPIAFEHLALNYLRYKDGKPKSRLEVGFQGDAFVFAFEQRALLLGLVLTAGLLLVTTGAIVSRNRRRRRRQSREQARLLAQRRHVEQGQEQERQRLARELHDGPLQALYALRMQLARRVPDLPAQDAAIAQIADHLRDVATALRSPLLAPFGLAAALQDLSLAYPGTEIEPTIDLQAEQLLDERTRNALFRIAQEATSNAVRHGHATRITTRLIRDRSHVRMTIRDNGTGFDATIPSEVYGSAGHYGLVGMHERVEVLGGTVRLQSSPTGTEIELILPVPEGHAPFGQGDGVSSTWGAPELP